MPIFKLPALFRLAHQPFCSFETVLHLRANKSVGDLFELWCRQVKTFQIKGRIKAHGFIVPRQMGSIPVRLAVASERFLINSGCVTVASLPIQSRRFPSKAYPYTEPKTLQQIRSLRKNTQNTTDNAKRMANLTDFSSLISSL